MNHVRIGIIGCGSIAATHIWAIEEDDRAELTALCDTNQERMMKVKGERACLTFHDWQDMLKSPEIDAVAICLPHYLHAPAMIDALNAGKHVICEKPLAVNLDQIKEMKEAAGKAAVKGIYSFGIFQHRYAPLVKEVKSLIEENAFGKLMQGEVHFLCTRDAAYYENDSWRGFWATEGGGTLINQGIHTLDMLFYLIGLPQEVEYNLFRERLTSIEVEDKGTGSLYYNPLVLESGKINLHFENDLQTDWKPDITIVGSRASITIHGSEEFRCSDTAITARINAKLESVSDKAPGKACYGSMHSHNYKDILDCLQKRNEGIDLEAEVSLESLADTSEAVLALYQSHFQGKALALPLENWQEPTALGLSEIGN